MGTMIAFFAYLERVYSPLRRLINSSTVLVQSIASIDRVFEFMNEQYDIVDKPNAINAERVHGDVIFENVSFQYDEETEVLKNINLRLEKEKPSH